MKSTKYNNIDEVVTQLREQGEVLISDVVVSNIKVDDVRGVFAKEGIVLLITKDRWENGPDPDDKLYIEGFKKI